jgi:hypothetical protein
MGSSQRDLVLIELGRHQPETPMTNTIAILEHDRERAYRALETARKDNDPDQEIYEARVVTCRDALEEARRPRSEPPTVIIVE